MTEGGGRGTLHSAEQLLEEESNYVKMQRIGSFLLTFLAFTATARATNWFILNGATERCVSAEAFAAKRGGAAFAFVSPLALRNALRGQPGWEGVKIIPLKGTLGRSVTIRFRKTRFHYFSSLAGCQAVRRLAVSSGDLTNLKALQ